MKDPPPLNFCWNCSTGHGEQVLSKQLFDICTHEYVTAYKLKYLTVKTVFPLLLYLLPDISKKVKDT